MNMRPSGLMLGLGNVCSSNVEFSERSAAGAKSAGTQGSTTQLTE